jgi:3-hydroxyanthranilate 3,4-dioxygenase
MDALRALNLQRWVDEHRHLLKPPVGNKLIFRASELIVMAVRGPNARRDFHVDPAEEFFHQLEGEMVLRVFEAGKIRELPIRAGEILLLPPRVPHSPQRPAHSVGLVIERQRRPGERDGLQWYCEHCTALLYEEYLELKDIETQFPPVFERFYANPEHRRCRQCGTVAPGPATASAPSGTRDAAR